jgi:drug/metabolite transporter (DMT)-like permease
MGPGELSGWAGAIVGSVLGLAGGVIGTWYSIRNTRGPRERRFVIQGALAFWGFVLLFLAGLMMIPLQHRVWLWVPYPILLVAAIVTFNRTQQRLRREEAEESASG